VRLVLIAAAVILGLALASGIALVVYRVRHRQASTPLVVGQVHPVTRTVPQAMRSRGPRQSIMRVENGQIL
jgi:hypothetical protein